MKELEKRNRFRGPSAPSATRERQTFSSSIAAFRNRGVYSSYLCSCVSRTCGFLWQGRNVHTWVRGLPGRILSSSSSSRSAINRFLTSRIPHLFWSFCKKGRKKCKNLIAVVISPYSTVTGAFFSVISGKCEPFSLTYCFASLPKFKAWMKMKSLDLIFLN